METLTRPAQGGTATSARDSGVTLAVHDAPQCSAVNDILARVGDKWSVRVVMSLADGSQRFNELRRGIPGISQRMLTRTLRGLERDGLVSRKVTPSVPPRVDYALTALGVSLCDPVARLGNWAIANIAKVETARAQFDAGLD
ncbi:winged helix-turn-helix transcriptional regulator [Qipengyuania sp. SM2507]